MKIGCSTLYKANGLKFVSEAAKEIKEAGFDSAQVHYEVITNYRPWISRYRGIFDKEETKKLRDLNFELTLHVPFSKLNYVHRNIALSKKALNFTTGAIEQMQDLGCKEFVMHMARKPEDMNFDRAIELFAERFNPFFNKLAKNNAKVFIENIESNMGVTPRIIKKALMLMPKASFCLDIGHANVHGLLNEFLELRVGHLHAHDNYGSADDHNVLGQGNINLEKVIKTLKNQKFNGTITIEPKSLKEGIESKKVIEKLWNK